MLARRFHFKLRRVDKEEQIIKIEEILYKKMKNWSEYSEEVKNNP